MCSDIETECQFGVVQFPQNVNQQKNVFAKHFSLQKKKTYEWFQSKGLKAIAFGYQVKKEIKVPLVIT